MATLIFFIIYLININIINSQNEFISKLYPKIFSKNKYQKLNKKYNVNIQIIEDRQITHEFLINTSYISKDYNFDFYYIGKFFYLNETNIDFLSNNSTDNKNWILLIKDFSTFNKYVSYNKSLLKHLTKAIIIPKNVFTTLDIFAKFCFNDLYVYLIEIEENNFNQILNSYSNKFNDDNNYYVKIISKKRELFPYIELYTLIIIISFLLLSFGLIYKLQLNKYADSYKEKQLNFLKNVKYYIETKFLILLLFLIDLNIFSNEKGFVFEKISLLKIVIIVFMLINKGGFYYFFLDVFYGMGIFFKDHFHDKAIKFYLSGFILIFDILFQIFVSPLKIPYAFYFLSLFIYSSIFLAIFIYSVKNMFFLLKVNARLRKNERFNNSLGGAIRLKIYIVFVQFIIYIFYILLFLTIHHYFLFMQGLCFELEKDILFQCLDCYLIVFISLIYIPRKWPNGFDLNILFIKSLIKSNKVQINAEYEYKSNIAKENLANEKEIEKFMDNNYQKYFSILNPKVFIEKEKEKQNKHLIKKNIKLGKLDNSKK